MGLDASAILPNLWQGSAPPVGYSVAQAGFTILVLCAQEYQPEAYLFPGVEVIHAPNDDNFEGITREQAMTAVIAGRRVAEAIKFGGKALVTCRQGRNRSGLVTAIAMHLVTKASGLQCIARIRRCRERAMRNPVFNAMVARLGA